jgi:hypothetical protein
LHGLEDVLLPGRLALAGGVFLADEQLYVVGVGAQVVLVGERVIKGLGVVLSPATSGNGRRPRSPEPGL